MFTVDRFDIKKAGHIPISSVTKNEPESNYKLHRTETDLFSETAMTMHACRKVYPE